MFFQLHLIAPVIASQTLNLYNFTPAKLNDQPQTLASFSSWSLFFDLYIWILN